MRRFTTLLTVLVLALGMLMGFTLAPSAVAQQASGSSADHPLVGTWVGFALPEDPTDISVGNFSADGSYTDVDSAGATGIGRWEATGDRSANVNIHYLEGGGMVTVRAAVDVAEDGQSLSATFTYEFTSSDGTSTGEYGPGETTANLITVEEMGSPVGSFEELFGMFEGTPEAATPES
jgi:hypothetical protein